MSRRISGLLRPCVLCLALVLLLCPAISMAETNTLIMSSASYDGVYVAFPAHRFMLYLPEAWQTSLSEDGSTFSAMEAEREVMSAFFGQVDDAYSMDVLLSAYETDVRYAGAQPVLINGIPYVAYALASGEATGYVTLSGDGVYLYDFRFPATAQGEPSSIALMVMTSLMEME